MSEQKPIVEVSVVIPVKDRIDDLKLTVESVKAQTVLPREIIIVDDFSAVPVSVGDFGEPGAVEIRVIRNEPNLGAAAACNRGAREARSPIIFFLDSDDCFAVDYVQKVHAAWTTATAKTVCIAAGFWWCTHELQPYREQVVTERVDRDGLLRRGNFVGGNSVLSVHREQFLAVDGFPNVRGAYDWGLMLRLSNIGEIATVPLPLLYYRSPSTSLLSNDTKNYRRQTLAICAIVNELPAADRAKANRVLLSAVAYNLAQAGRTKMCRRLTWSLMRRYGAFRDVFHIALALFLGGRSYGGLLRRFAYMRAERLARTLPPYASHTQT